jgi:aryl-alcohol dehydrogenase-like predicted oxidoreductase
MPLPTSPLGRSGMHITRLGFGSWAVGGGGWAFGWGPQDDDASLATMRHAIDAGLHSARMRRLALETRKK